MARGIGGAGDSSYLPQVSSDIGALQSHKVRDLTSQTVGKHLVVKAFFATALSTLVVSGLMIAGAHYLLHADTGVLVASGTFFGLASLGTTVGVTAHYAGKARRMRENVMKAEKELLNAKPKGATILHCQEDENRQPEYRVQLTASIIFALIYGATLFKKDTNYDQAERVNLGFSSEQTLSRDETLFLDISNMTPEQLRQWQEFNKGEIFIPEIVKELPLITIAQQQLEISQRVHDLMQQDPEAMLSSESSHSLSLEDVTNMTPDVWPEERIVLHQGDLRTQLIRNADGVYDLP